MNNLLSTKQTAERLGISDRTLEKWRLTGESPPYLKLGRRTVRYDPDVVSSWSKEKERSSTSDPDGPQETFGAGS